MGKGQAVIDSPLTGSAPAAEISAGYRRIEVGVIPEDWKLGRLSDFGVFRSGSGFPLIYQGLPSGDYPFFKVSDMNNQGNDLSMEIANHWISEDVRKKLGAAKHPVGSIVFAKIGAAIFLERKRLLSRESCIDNNMMTFSLTDHHACQRYFYYLFFHLELGKYVSMTALPSLSGRLIGAISVATPPPDEQRAIAKALSDVDRLIESLDALIAKKRAIKQATMQQLLTGRIRLPGFSGKWKTRRLGRLGPFLKGRGVKREDISSTGFSCVRYGELYTRYENYVLNAVTRIPSSVAKLALPIKTGDLLFAGSGETSEEIGRCAAYLGEEPAYAGGDILVLTPLEQNSLYLGYLMNQPMVTTQKARLGQGDAVVHVNAHNLAQIEINLPPVEEQTAIAAVLSNMDTEIAALEQRRDKTRALKQGMMQQLLTGKIRLVDSVQTTMGQASSASTGKGHNWQINEAVVISVLTGRFGNEEYPLGRMRYTKLSYLLHRHVEGRAEGYLKKAAGPYNPRTRYSGPEKIALEKGYVRKCTSGKYQGFIAGDNAEESERYFDRWYGREALQWLEQFRYKKNNDLELLTTVDMAIEELRAEGEAVSIESVREVIHCDPEWTKKLARPTFSSANLERAIGDCEQLFGR